jgi:tRNA pseudouridine(38-40) synthase
MKRQQSSSSTEDSEQKKAKSSHLPSSLPLDTRKEYDDEDRHEGSFPLEEVQAMEEYSRRISQPPSTKRKYALAIAYCGTNYHGLQVNPGAITIEAILERALLLCGAIQESNYGHLQKISWTRAARTDKGVHAVGQCCSMKLEFPESQTDLFLEQLNSFLPEDIRVLAVTRTTKSFNARIHCSHRRYEYLLPSYLLMPEGGVADLFRSHATPSERHRALSEFRMPEETLTRLRTVLQLYQGTHYYHNFTSDKGKGGAGGGEAVAGDKQKGKMKGDPTMMRYMMSLAVDPCDVSCEPVEGAGEGTRAEWLKITILGQSFLLNQV